MMFYGEKGNSLTLSAKSGQKREFKIELNYRLSERKIWSLPWHTLFSAFVHFSSAAAESSWELPHKYVTKISSDLRARAPSRARTPASTQLCCWSACWRKLSTPQAQSSLLSALNKKHARSQARTLCAHQNKKSQLSCDRVVLRSAIFETLMKIVNFRELSGWKSECVFWRHLFKIQRSWRPFRRGRSFQTGLKIM